MDIKKKMRRVWTKKGKAKFPECVNRLKITAMSIHIPFCGGDRGKPPFLHQPLLLQGVNKKSLKIRDILPAGIRVTRKEKKNLKKYNDQQGLKKTSHYVR